MSNTDGGPAFPAHENWRLDSGMTLRDYFAAKAMQGLVSAGVGVDEQSTFTVAEWAYDIADIMLAERAK